MADKVYTAELATSGTTAAFGADEIILAGLTTAQYPRLKIFVGAGSTGTDWQGGYGTSAAAGRVILANDQPDIATVLKSSTTQIGRVGGLANSVTVTASLSHPGAYAANEYVGTDATPMEFAGMAHTSGGTGVIGSAVLIDNDLQSIPLELWLFDRPVVPSTDNAAFTLGDTHLTYCVGVIPFSGYYATTGNSISQVGNLGMWFECDTTATSLYGLAVTRGAPSYTTNGLVFRLFTSQD